MDYRFKTSRAQALGLGVFEVWGLRLSQGFGGGGGGDGGERRGRARADGTSEVLLHTRQARWLALCLARGDHLR